MSVIDSALASGLAVFPCKQDKRPFTPNGFHDAVSDPAEVRELFGCYPQATAYGIATGELVVIDVDVSRGDGFASLAALEAKYGKLPETLRVNTPSGGCHMYFKATARFGISAGKLAPHIDVRAFGGYVIGAGSVTAGGTYEPANDVPVADVPDWLAGLLMESAASEVVAEDIRILEYSMPEDPIVSDAISAKLCVMLADAAPGTSHAVAVEVCGRAAGYIAAGQLSLETFLSDFEAAHESRQDHDSEWPAIRAFLLECTGKDAVKQQHPAGKRLARHKASEVTLRRAKWLWDGRLPLGELSLLAGDGGIGKSTVACWLAAELTKGTLDGELRGKPSRVLICATEDSREVTLKPRVLAAGADLDRIEFITMTDSGHELPMEFPSDIGELTKAMAEPDVVAIILDPIISRLSGKLDTHKEQEVRQALEPLVAAAHETGCAVIGIIHPNKSESRSALNAITGSKAFVNTVRAVVFAERDSEDEDTFVLGQVKNNLGRMDVPTLRYRLESVEVGHDADDGYPVTAGRVVWEDAPSFLTVEEHRDAGRKRSSKTSECATWLTSYLTSEQQATVTEASALAAGFSAKVLRTARERAGVTTTQRADGWWWSL